MRSFQAWRREFPKISWVNPVTNEQLIGQDTENPGSMPARVVTEVSPPAITYGETAVDSAERQPDGSWLQTWTVEEITLAQAKAILRDLARSILADKVVQITAAEQAMVAEVSRARVDTAITQSNYPLIQAVQADRGITFGAAATYSAGLVDSWIAQVALVIPKYLDVIDRIAAASTRQEAKDILDELEALTP